MNSSDDKNVNYTNENYTHDISKLLKSDDKPDFTPEKEKIKGPSHVKAENDKVEKGDNLSDEFSQIGGRGIF